MSVGLAQKYPAALVIVCAGLLVALALQQVGEPAYQAAAIAKQIAREDSDLCSTFGFAPNRTRFEDCMRELADLRIRHESLVVAYSWP